jgi:hypothetical protein
VLRGLGLTYFVAFASLRGQVRGLYGRRGILPVEPSLAAFRGAPRLTRWRLLPTLLWFDASDRGLVRLCVAGQLAGLALAAGVFPRPAAASALALHLSFVSAGEPFLNYQWDALLLEAGWLGVLAAPAGTRLRWGRGDPSPRLALSLLRLLAFRLHFESGLAKVQSGDRAWRDGSACAYHYETQPLPTPLAPRAHRLPRWFHVLSTTLVRLLETVVPLAAFGPRRTRRRAFLALEGLQAAIAATGNFAFFNLLSGVLLLSVLDGPRARQGERRGRARGLWGAIQETAAEFAGLLSLLDLHRRAWPRRTPPAALERIDEALAPLRPVSSYGLFAVMTRERLEIVIEGSLDGHTWRPYRLPHQPGDVQRPPRWIAPWQPRLDWQMWFAALSPTPPRWFPHLLRRLLQGEGDVLALFESNPFPEGPPRMVRALIYRYRLHPTANGTVWDRELLGAYFPSVALPDHEWPPFATAAPLPP